ncbi:MAG: hypothetical protein ACOCVD_03490, partial [Bacillota bacterium]
MRYLQNNIENYSVKSVILFFIVTFIFSWFIWLPVIIFNLDTNQNLIGLLLFMLGGFGPSIVGLFFLKKSNNIKLKERLLSI